MLKTQLTVAYEAKDRLWKMINEVAEQMSISVEHRLKNSHFSSSEDPTTQIGNNIRNNQKSQGTLGALGTGYLQQACRLEYLQSGHVYGANGSGVAECKCPECQGGGPGIRYRK